MKWIKYVLLGILIIITALGLWWAVVNGIAAAKSKQILKDVAAIQEGFEFFKQDQQRYPSQDEFADNDIMRGYLSGFPPEQFPTAQCSETYDYFNAFPNSYELRFCLPKAIQGYQAGWNKVTN